MEEKVEIINAKEMFRVMVDLNVSGNANGGKFILCKGLKEKIKEIEKSGKIKVVGFVYDETDRLEILTQDIEMLEKAKELSKKGITI
jgi:hypothetical protein